jgi:signal peptidase II
MRARLLSRLLLVGGAVTVLVADQLSKLWVVANLPEYTPVNVFPWLSSILSFTYVKNTGVAFGLFPQLGDFFTILSVLVIGGIVVFQRSLPVTDRWVHLSLGLLTGGALGNLLDRLLRGYVVDYLDVNFWPLHAWPVFNVADSAILVGVTVLLVDSFFFNRQEIPADA